MTVADIIAFHNKSIPIEIIESSFLRGHNISLSILRSDQLHPQISGNKWFKLKYNLQAARQSNHHTLLSFGGAWSNHIHALASAGRQFGFKTIGIIRGELSQPLNPCLADAFDNGMSLKGVSRTLYRDKTNPHFIESLQQEFGEFYLIPEGGANQAGVLGCRELLNSQHWQDYDQICLACGTGATLAGLISSEDGSKNAAKVLGVQVLKGKDYLMQEVESLVQHHELQVSRHWEILDDFHGGGYARCSAELLQFITEFKREHDIPLEPIYSGKLIFALYQLIEQGYFPAHSKLLAIHGGGLQGLRGTASL